MFDYMKKYLAHLVQKPSELPGVSLVLRGDQGSGKTSFFDKLGKKMLGAKYLLLSEKPDDIVGKFNSNKNKLLVVMDEMEGSTGVSSSSIIKGLITQSELTYEQKGKDKMPLRNCGRYIFTSNRATPVLIEPTDRRFVVSQTSNAHLNDRVFFGKVFKEWDDPIAVRNFYDYLMNIDISEFDPARDRVLTDAYEDMQESTIPHLARFFDYKYNNILCNNGEMKRIKKATALFLGYEKYMDTFFKNSKYVTNITKFGRDIKQFEGIEKKRGKTGIVYVIDYEILYAYMKRKKFVKELVYTEFVEDVVDIDEIDDKDDF
jgi:hypothetical protein